MGQFATFVANNLQAGTHLQPLPLRKQRLALQYPEFGRAHFAPRTIPFDVAEDGLIVWPDGKYEEEAIYKNTSERQGLVEDYVDIDRGILGWRHE